ncbi:hypothetical protein BV22DRAFT_942152 [Leucogyrophana mollusca]|uniref:Uncharacterized protein n=1 Tax=Leucogyrophana mollusca TaxID=85980 RepID=A0ACB8AV99_9AGAM|nr:hypothetical protein BV22DRAFT_942152 [Leucogyrophana mollusca]
MVSDLLQNHEDTVDGKSERVTRDGAAPGYLAEAQTVHAFVYRSTHPFLNRGRCANVFYFSYVHSRNDRLSWRSGASPR